MTDVTPEAGPELACLARAERAGLERSDFNRDTRSAVRYADPSTWALLGAVRETLSGLRDWDPREVGLIAFDPWGPQEAMAKVQSQQEEGRISPLHFVAAFAHSATGAACISGELQGPSLTLTVPPRQAGVALDVARRWIGEGSASHVLVASIDPSSEGGGRARALALAARGPGSDGEPVDEVELAASLSSPALG